MKKMLTNNLGLKLLSLVSAIILWLVVIYLDDPIEYQDFSPIRVTMLNEDVVTSQDKVYRIEDNSDVISVRVKAHTSVLRKLSAEDFTATADMKKNIKLGNLVGIDVTCSNKNVESANIKKSRENVVISIEDGSTEQFNVVVDTEGKEAEGYVVGTAVPEQSMIEISGPSSVIEKIRRVVVQIKITGINSDRRLHGELQVLDGDGDKVDTTYLEYTGKTEGMGVNVTVLRTKTVPLKIGYTGTPAEGYSFGKISYKPETVKIAGASKAISGISELVIPDEAVNIDGISENLQQTIDIAQYLPEDIRLADADDTHVAVVVEIEKKQGKTVEIPVSEIGLKNVPKGYEVDFGDTEFIELVVMGTSAELSELDQDEIAVSLNLSGFSKAGTYTEKLDVTLPGDCSLMEEAEAEFKLVRGTGQNNNQDSNGGTSGSETDKNEADKNEPDKNDSNKDESGEKEPGQDGTSGSGSSENGKPSAGNGDSSGQDEGTGNQSGRTASGRSAQAQ